MNKEFSIDDLLVGYESIALVAHDAGAAAHIASWFSSSTKKLSIYAEGPAEDMFRKVFDGRIEESLSAAVDTSSVVITGTGWSSDLEHQARKLAFSRNIPSVAVLDHWVNYRERFKRNGTSQLPGELWVSDAEAATLASLMFPKIPVKQLPNYWLEGLRTKVNSIRCIRKRAFQPSCPAKRLIYLLEPIRVLWNDGSVNKSEAGEFQGLRYWLNQFPHLIAQGLVAPTDQIEACYPPSPFGAIGKYDSFISEYKAFWPISIDSTSGLDESLMGRCSFRLQTQALVAAMACGLPAFSTVPPWAPPCSLPQVSLNHLSRLENL